MPPLTRVARVPLLVFVALTLARRSAAQSDQPIPPQHHGLYVTNSTSQCAWITITSADDKNRVQPVLQAKGGVTDARSVTGPLWVAGHRTYRFVVREAYRLKVRAEVQKSDCAAYHGRWDTGSIAGGNVFDTAGDVPDRHARRTTGVVLRRSGGNYYLEFDTSK